MEKKIQQSLQNSLLAIRLATQLRPLALFAEQMQLAIPSGLRGPRMPSRWSSRAASAAHRRGGADRRLIPAACKDHRGVRP